MKNLSRTFLSLVVAIFVSAATFCLAGADLELAKQWESRGNYAKAGYHYDQAGDQEVNLDKRAKLHARSLKCYLKTDDSHSATVEAGKIRQYARDGGVSLLKELAPNFLDAGRRQAKNYDNAKAYEHLSTYISYHPNERNKLADEFNRSGNKELAQMLNPALKVFDCKSMLTKAGKVDDVETSLSNYAQYASACTNMSASPNDCQAVFKTAEAATDSLNQAALLQSRSQYRLFAGSVHPSPDHRHH